jgi:hypothetical protein
LDFTTPANRYATADLIPCQKHQSQSLSNTDFKKPEQVLESLNVAFPGEENNDGNSILDHI